MSNKTFVMTAIFIVLLINAYPIYQAFETGGLLFYSNAYDEITYLQYDFSLMNQRVSRVGQYPVTALHNAGLSAGWINFVFDIVFPLSFIVLLRAIFKKLGYDSKDSNIYSLLMIGLPLLFGGLNPIIKKLFYLNLSSGFIYWVSISEAAFLPIIRTPEPQFSLVVAALSVYLSLRLKSFLPSYFCVPVLYPFIAVPFAFITTALHLRTRISSYLALMASFIIISAMLAIYFGFFVDAKTKEYLVESHYPLISFTSLFAVIIYLAGKNKIPERFRYAAMAVAISPMMAANQQIISGWITQPNNFEQNFGLYCVSIVAVMAFIFTGRVYKQAGVVFVVFLIAYSSYLSFVTNHQTNSKLKLDERLLTALTEDSSSVAISNVGLSDTIGMIYPKQAPTMFAFIKTFSVWVRESFPAYQCFKNRVRELGYKDEFQEVFDTLDRSYVYGNKDFILLHFGRKKDFKKENDLGFMPEDCPDVNNLKIFIANERE